MPLLSVGVFFDELMTENDSRHDIRRKLRARYRYSISDQELDLIARTHARHGAEKVGSFFAAKIAHRLHKDSLQIRSEGQQRSRD